MENTLDGNAVSGDFKTPLQQPQSGSGNTTAMYSQFTSYVPETGDPNLLPSLEKYSVQVTAQPVQLPWWQTALTILLNAFPILLLVYFGYMALRSVWGRLTMPSPARSWNCLICNHL
jgi:hypothetical protein